MSKVQDRYEVVDYHDVWRDEEDGWQVNNLSKIGYILVTDYTDYEELVGHLIAMGYLKEGTKPTQIDWWNDYDMIEAYDKTSGIPIFRLERNQNSEVM